MPATPPAPASTSETLITNHVLTIPHPQHAHFLTQIVHLRSSSQNSLFVHCTSISATLAHSLTSRSTTSSSEITTTDDAEDIELNAALAAAGRAPLTPSTSSTQPLGALASDFALALSSPSGTLGTPILTSSTASTTASLANSMSKRIASKLSIPHLLLSLDLPPPLIASVGRVQSPEDSRAVLALEKAIRDACSATLTSQSGTLSA